MKPAPRILPIGLVAGSLLAAGPALAVVCNVPSMTHATIQSAASDMACTEIVVAAGTYTEQITVGRPGSIYLHGAGAGRTIIRSPAMRAPSTLPTTFYPNYTYVVQVPPGLAANIADLTIDGTGNSFCGEPFFGVRFNNANGSLERVVVENVRSPGAALGCQNTIAVAMTAEAGGGGSLTVLRSTVRNFQKVGILVNGATANAGIFNTVVRGVGPTTFTAQNGVQISRGASANVQNSIITGIHYTGDTCLGAMDTQVGSGVLAYQANQVTVVDNYITASDRAITLLSNTGSQIVTTNRLVGNYSGIASQGNAAGVVRISDNRVTGTIISDAVNAATCFPDTGNGISVEQENGTTLVLNHLADNARSGIELLPAAAGADVQQNRSVRGTRADLENRGAGNSVSQNTCNTSLPAGLCAFAP